jgi:hypothetical protein
MLGLVMHEHEKGKFIFGKYEKYSQKYSHDKAEYGWKYKIVEITNLIFDFGLNVCEGNPDYISDAYRLLLVFI